MHEPTGSDPRTGIGVTTSKPVPTKQRDLFLDLLRAVSIVRVVPLHILAKSRLSWWPAPTFVLPGMPLVFFVSGGLARVALARREGTRLSATAYWRKSLRRLMVPYWATYAAVILVALVGDALSDSNRWSIRYHSLFWGTTGLIVPKPSPAVSRYIGHLWFMSAFLILAIAAPMLVRWYERSRVTLFAGLLAVFGLVQFAQFHHWLSVPRELDRVTLFSIFYCCGFMYTDGTIQRRSRWTLAGGALVLALMSVRYHFIEPGAVNASDPKHLLVGGAGLCLLLAAAPTVRRIADAVEPVLRRVTKRTFTTYLWGWPTCLLAETLASETTTTMLSYRVVLATCSLGFLAVAIALFGWVEDVAARR